MAAIRVCSQVGRSLWPCRHVRISSSGCGAQACVGFICSFFISKAKVCEIQTFRHPSSLSGSTGNYFKNNYTRCYLRQII